MSLCLRPVVETWGPSMTYLTRDIQISDLLDGIVSMIESTVHLSEDATQIATYEYGDMTVIWISNGKLFLDFLSTTKPEAILEYLERDAVTSRDDIGAEEYERVCEDVAEFCQSAESWRASIDPQDGSLRLYCD